MDFYLTLPSNTTDEYDNKINKFRVRLPNTIDLVGQWEVALVEIIYPHCWPNVKGLPLMEVPQSYDDMKNMPSQAEVNKAENIIWFNYIPFERMDTLVVPPGYYATPHELIKSIEKGLKRQMHRIKAHIKLIKKDGQIDTSDLPKLSDAIKFSYDSVLKRVKLKLDTSVVDTLVLGRHLQYMLGLEDGDGQLKTFSKPSYVAKYPCDLCGGFYALHIFCDLVERQILGDSRVQLLRIVPVEGGYGDIISKTFFSPHYVQLLKKQFNTVEICIKDDRNRFVPFDFGKCILKLHFRKKRPIPL